MPGADRRDRSESAQHPLPESVDVARRPPQDLGESAAEAGWLMLVYRIPSEPSRLRAGVWRKLKGHGAIYLQNSVAALPDVAGHERVLRTLRADIVQIGGTAQVFRAAALAGGSGVVAAYNAARDDEYDELVDKCHDFLTEIETETAAGHVTYGELEENEEDLTKLRRWLAKISERDVLDAEGAAAARSALTECERALDEFAHLVYGADPDAR
jgi:hypothetical protein